MCQGERNMSRTKKCVKEKRERERKKKRKKRSQGYRIVPRRIKRVKLRGT